MRMWKKLLSLICTAALLLSMCSGALAAEDSYVLTAADCTVAENSDGSVTIIKINSDIATVKTDLTIPATLDGKAVTAIGTGEENKNLFPTYTTLTRVRLPEGLLRIEGYAFTQCGSLREVNLPSTLVSIGPHAFYLRYSLKSIAFNEGLASIGEYAFRGTGLDGTLSLPASVTTLASGAFSDTEITDIGAMEGVTEWPDSLFSECDYLTSVVVPDQVTSMGASLFSYCDRLESVVLPDGLETISDGMFRQCIALTSVEIPNTVTTIEGSAFSGNTILAQVALPQNLTALGDRAFSSCRSLTSIDIPDGVTRLGTCTFEHCWSLREIQLPNELKEVGYLAFEQCKVLQSLIFPAGLEKLGVLDTGTYADAFGYTPSLLDITFLGDKPITTTRPFASAPSSGHHKDLTIYHPVGNTTYADWTKWGYPKVVAGGPNIPDAVDTTIALSAVLRKSADQKHLELWLTTTVSPQIHPESSALAPSGTISFTLNGNALPPPTHFVGGGSTLYRTVGYNVEDYIGDEITIQAHLSPSLGFYGSASDSLVGLVIPMPKDDAEHPFVPKDTPSDPIYTTITDGSGGVIITKINGEMATRPVPIIPSTLSNLPVTGLGDGLFANNSFITHVNIPKSVKTLGTGVFQNCLYLSSVSLSDGITAIPASTFSGCSKRLQAVNLPGNTVSIGENAFRDCAALPEITLPAALKTLDRSAFSGCTLTNVTFEGNAPTLTGTDAPLFDHWTILHTKQGATGFHVAPWSAMRREPVALGISFDPKAVSFPSESITADGFTMLIPITFDTKAYRENAPDPDLSKVNVYVYNHLMDNVTVVGDKLLSVQVDKIYYGAPRFTRVSYPGDWYYGVAASENLDVSMPAPKLPSAITAVITQFTTEANGTIKLWLTPTITPTDYYGQAYTPSLLKMEVKLGETVCERIGVENGRLYAVVPDSLVGSTLPLTVTFMGDTRFAPSSPFSAGDVTVPGQAPDTTPPSGGGSTGGGGSGSSAASKPSADENAKVTVSNKDVTAAVKAAADSGSVVLKAATSENAKSVAVTVPASVMKAVSKAEAPVSIQSPVADLTLDVKVLESLQANGVKDVVVSAGAADTADLPKAAQDFLTGRPVYDINITSGGKTVSQFGGGTVTVALPYTPAQGENPATLVACWVKDEGTMEVLQSSSFTDGKLSFKTPHLSTYAIVHREVSFPDVEETSWAKPSIDFVAARDILGGTGDGFFSPTLSPTGTMAVVALARMDGVADGAPGPDWAAPALAWAEEKDILPQGFDPNATLTREQVAYLVAHAMGEVKSINGTGYVDTHLISRPCLDSVSYLTSTGIMRGTGDGCFSPQLPLTRGELAAVLQRLMTR